LIFEGKDIWDGERWYDYPVEFLREEPKGERL